MFKPKTERIEKLSQIYPERITELENIFKSRTNVYLDYANIYHWSKKLSWHLDPKRLKQLFDSFDTIQSIRLYNGTLENDKNSEQFIKDVGELGYKVITKPVKKMNLSIDVSGIPLNSPVILENFIKKPFLKIMTLETIEYLNSRLKEINDHGLKYIVTMKCNFDVEIGRDMLDDYDKNSVDTFILWSGDSDFADPVSQLLSDKKKVLLFATVRRVSIELQQTGVPIFEIQKIRNFICRASEIQDEIKKKLPK